MTGDSLRAPLASALDGRAFSPSHGHGYVRAIEEASRKFDPDVLGSGASYVFLLNSWEEDDLRPVCPVCGEPSCGSHLAVPMPVDTGTGSTSILVCPD